MPYGATTEGFGGTYATQENFRIMREALDAVSERLGRYVMLTNYASGLCMPEIATMAALERLDMLLNDSMYGILFRDINMKRTFVDQHFSRMLNARSGIVINTGEDNYLTTADAVEQAPAVLASQFINEAFAHRAGMPDAQIGLGDAYEIDPSLEDGFLYALAQAQLARQIFPDAPLKYMPPTKHMTGDVFKGHLIDAMFNLTSVMTKQTIHLCGMMTEAIHTPFLGDRALALENARYVMSTARHLGDDIEFKRDGIVERRAQSVLRDAHALLERVAGLGLMAAIDAKTFADVKRSPDGGPAVSAACSNAPGITGIRSPKPSRPRRSRGERRVAKRVRGRGIAARRVQKRREGGAARSRLRSRERPRRKRRCRLSLRRRRRFGTLLRSNGQRRTLAIARADPLRWRASAVAQHFRGSDGIEGPFLCRRDGSPMRRSPRALSWSRLGSHRHDNANRKRSR